MSIQKHHVSSTYSKLPFAIYNDCSTKVWQEIVCLVFRICKMKTILTFIVNLKGMSKFAVFTQIQILQITTNAWLNRISNTSWNVTIQTKIKGICWMLPLKYHSKHNIQNKHKRRNVAQLQILQDHAAHKSSLHSKTSHTLTNLSSQHKTTP